MTIFDSPLEKVPFSEMGDIPLATAWLDKYPQLTPWIDGKFVNPIEQPDCHCFSLEHGVGINKVTKIYKSDNLAEAAVRSSCAAQSKWCLEPESRFDALYRLKESLSSTSIKCFEELNVVCGKGFDKELFIDYMNYYTGLPCTDKVDGESVGVVLVVLSQETPDWVMCMTVMSALLSGCSVILMAFGKVTFTPFFFAQICMKSGLQDGLVNVVLGSRSTIEKMCAAGVNKVVFHGNHIEAKEVIHSNKTFLNTNHTTAILLEPCDLQGVVDILFAETWNEARYPTWSVKLVVVQESIFHSFLEKITDKIHKFRDGMNNKLIYEDKNIKSEICELVERKKMMGLKVIESEVRDLDCWGPTLILECGMELEETTAPVMRVVVGRTAKESIELANTFPYSLATSVWTESPSQAVEVASKLMSSMVWINCHGVVDPSVSLEPSRVSEFGSFGGVNDLKSYLSEGSFTGKNAPSSNPCEPTLANELIEISMTAFAKWKVSVTRHCCTRAVLEDMNNVEELKEYRETVKYWAVNGNSYETSSRGTIRAGFYVSQSKEPVGVVYVNISNDATDPVDAFVSLVTPAVAFGNAVIVNLEKVSDPKMRKVADCFAKYIPKGVVTITKDLGSAYLTDDSRIAAVWLCGGSAVPKILEISPSLKKVWVTPERVPRCKDLLQEHCLRSKTIWFTKSTEG